MADAARRDDAPRTDRPDSGHAQQRLILRAHDLHGELLRVADCPEALRVDTRVEVRVLLVEQLLGAKTVKPQEPVRLIEPVLAQERRLGVKRGEQAALDDGDIGGVEHAFETVLGIERLGQVQDVPVGILRRADDELGALSGGGEGGRVLILRELGLALARLIADEPHRAQNGAPGLVRGQRPQPLLGRKLDVDAQPVGQQPQPVHQLRRRAGDGLGVDVAVEAIVLAQDTQ